MTHERLIQTVVSIIIMAGYNVSERYGMRPRSFDLVAEKNGVILVIKIVPRIDSVTEGSARDLSTIARYLDGKPLIVGEKARNVNLERGAVYLRYGIIATSATTLYDYFVEEIPPLVYAHPGGLYVNINGNLLHTLRERNQMSLGDLAYILGVSRRTISKYESGMSTTLDIAVKLEEIFDTALVEAIDLLSHESVFDYRDVLGVGNIPPDFERMGLEIHVMQRAPFQVLATYGEEKILAGYGSAQKTIRRAALIGNISDITNSRAICVITDYNKTKKVGKTLVVGEGELSSLKDGLELIELIDE